MRPCTWRMGHCSFTHQHRGVCDLLTSGGLPAQERACKARKEEGSRRLVRIFQVHDVRNFNTKDLLVGCLGGGAGPAACRFIVQGRNRARKLVDAWRGPAPVGLVAHHHLLHHLKKAASLADKVSWPQIIQV
ncbi:hypothetical protein PVAP13_9KG561201 [Panicum virgatum]|uniref:Uncharacterized protein n=1 Tax=Panicum virgatum TaxID=38727 RepID=A0A8T0P0V8_PANVG|nr:hypothetical protein PVAP13_9KG561201 [Panicum virgatum]